MIVAEMGLGKAAKYETFQVAGVIYLLTFYFIYLYLFIYIFCNSGVWVTAIAFLQKSCDE